MMTKMHALSLMNVFCIYPRGHVITARACIAVDRRDDENLCEVSITREEVIREVNKLKEAKSPVPDDIFPYYKGKRRILLQNLEPESLCTLLTLGRCHYLRIRLMLYQYLKKITLQCQIVIQLV